MQRVAFFPSFRSTLLELGKTLMPAPVVVNGPAVTDFEVAHQAEREAAQHRMADRGKAQIFSAKEAAADKRESSPQPLELSTMKMNPQAPGWNTRLVKNKLLPIRYSGI